MVPATRHRSAHLETVLELALEADEPTSSAAQDLGDRALGVRRVLGFAGAALGVVLVAVVATGIATASSGGPEDAPAIQDARDAVPMRARVWEQAHDPATAYPWRSEAGVQRMGSP
jgi:hypothetical protein